VLSSTSSSIAIFSGRRCRKETYMRPAVLASRWRVSTKAVAGITGFEYRRLQVGDAEYQLATGGDGPAVVLLHGYPQTHYTWRHVAPELARSHTVVAPDLRGYGASDAPPGGPHGEGYSKREMAAELVQLLDRLGIERAAVVGHDRGARVAYRMALDHPDRVERLAVLNIVPTVDQFERVTAENAIGYWPFFLLAQPAPFPERLIAAAPDHYVRWVINDWTEVSEATDEEAMRHYVEAFTEDSIASHCSEYRASFHLDRRIDAADRDAGRRIGCPLLFCWGELDPAFADPSGPLEIWRGWAEEVEARPLPAGHFIPEESPEELLEALGPFLGAQSERSRSSVDWSSLTTSR
jgi:haloacetate dehalogenase